MVYRLACGVVVGTWFDADEYWQSMEVAHNLVFGVGHMTWEWREMIRGWVHPLIFACVYKVLLIMGCDTAFLVIYAPRFIQAVFCAIGDIFVWKLATRIWGPQVGKYAFICQLLSWFTFFAGVRTLVNSLETSLTVVSLYFWDFPGMPSPTHRHARALAISIASFQSALKFIVLELAPVGLSLLFLSTLIDRLFYGVWTLVPLNFLYHNVFQSVSEFYGTHPWHWYFTIGFPSILGSFAPLMVLGIYRSKSYALLLIILGVLLEFTPIPHKEFRFIFPALPLAMCYCGYFVHDVWTRTSSGSKLSLSRVLILFLFGLQITSALYFSIFHQAAPIKVMKFLREADKPIATDILFLTGCHSTPYHTHIHRRWDETPVNMTFLDCSPSHEDNHVDESEYFKAHPLDFTARLLQAPFDQGKPLPSHIVTQSQTEPLISSFLEKLGYNKCATYYHEPIQATTMSVWCQSLPNNN
ncbi:GPI mannosyltransferase 3 [Pelomyxa schiedti]|nr:GPI mannosyltransferase 3 [Pelomyxa schiedti]